MSHLVMSQNEIATIDSRVEKMMDWAQTSRAEAEQLALDATRLMSCTGERMDRLAKQNFFKRCWNHFIGETDEIARANTNDLIQMQKISLRYVNMLQERQLLMAHAMLSLKNNMLSLSIAEEETKNLVLQLAEKTLERFNQLESRVDQLEISTNLQGWLLGLEERDYDEKIPTEYMRLFRIINDFYSIKNDNWNYNDLMFMRKAIRTVGINPKKRLSLNAFIDTLVDEIQSSQVGFNAYEKAITLYKPQGVANYSKFAVENISSPVFTAIHDLKTQYVDRLEIVEELQEEMNISTGDALKRLLRRGIARLNVNLDYEFPLAETAIEILACMRLIEKLSADNSKEKDADSSATMQKEKIATKTEQTEKSEQEQNVNSDDLYQYREFDIDKVTLGQWKSAVLPEGKLEYIECINDTFWCVFKTFSEIHIYISKDIEDFELLSTIDSQKINGSIEADSFCIEKIFYINNFVLIYIKSYIYSTGNLLIVFNDLYHYDIIKLTDHEHDLYDIIYRNNIWYILTLNKYCRKIIYKKKGLIFDSEDYQSCTDANIYCGTTLTNLRLFSTTEYSYSRGDVQNISYDVYTNKFIATVKIYDSACDDGKYLGYTEDIIISDDGKEWKRMYVHSDMWYVKFINYQNRFLIYSGRNLYYIHPITSNIEKYSTNDEIRFEQFYNSTGIALGDNSDGIFISNDLIKVKAVDLDSTLLMKTFSDHSGSPKYGYGNGLFILWTDKGLLYRTLNIN